MKRIAKQGVRVGALLVMFGVGYLCGSAAPQRVDAQMGDLGKEAAKSAMQQAGESGGAMGSAVKLGTAIVEMQQNVDALQKNIDVLKQVKAGLGG